MRVSGLVYCTHALGQARLNTQHSCGTITLTRQLHIHGSLFCFNTTGPVQLFISVTFVYGIQDSVCVCVRAHYNEYVFGIVGDIVLVRIVPDPMQVGGINALYRVYAYIQVEGRSSIH